jgi:hypothetical protein
MSAAAAPVLAQSDSGATRMLIGPTAETLPRGEGYIGVYGLMVPYVQVGITDALTIGGGSPIVPFLFTGGVSRGRLPFLFTAKARLVHRTGTSVSTGIVHFGVAGGGGSGLAYAMGTRRLEAGSVSLGGGCLYVSGRDGSPCQLVLTAGASGDVNARLSVLTENYLLPGKGALVSGGVRLKRTRFATDLGLLILVGDGLLPGVVVNFTYRLGGS